MKGDFLVESSNLQQEKSDASDASNASSSLNEKGKGISEEIGKAISERRSLISKAKKIRDTLSYKRREKNAIDKLLEMNKEKLKEIRKLIKRRESLEFKIATEAFTLDAEKELIKKKEAVESELSRLIHIKRMANRSRLLQGDVEKLESELKSVEEEIKAKDKVLDELFAKIRSKRQKKPKVKNQKEDEISLSDIALIKKENEKGEKKEGK
ncbi:MAG: hypothetical protein QXL16_02145 [Candidatus Micrarchaeaceae archaeon]